jgi:tetratricopeptide (TPR) repeat protein
MSKRTSLLVAAAGLALTASVARADTPPSVWDIAKDPSLADHWALHVRVERLLSGPPRDEDVPHLEAIGDVERRTMAALAMLEDAGAADSPDVMLRFDLGTVLYALADNSERMDLFTKAARTLQGALAMSPDGPGSTAALGRLAEACAKLDRPFDEIATWHKYIPRLLDPRARAVDTMNLGEAEMRIGHVDDALATFRDVMQQLNDLPGTNQTYVLTLWDIAVALDRSGDARGALQTAAKVTHMTSPPSHVMMRGGDGVFFVPAWERYWYLALGSEAIARDDRDPREAVMYLIEAEDEWDEYIKGASLSALDGQGGSSGAGASSTRADREDPVQAARASWLRIAHLRRARVHAEQMAARKRLPPSVRVPAPETE